MVAGDRERLGATFDRSAELYDKIRPGYPDQLFDDLVSLTGIQQTGRILEIGCGTAKATVPLAKRGYQILCLEPGENLATIARRNLTPFPNVQVENVGFEDWQAERGAFDVVMAATSFAWLEPAVRYWKTAAALREGGCAALFWHAHVRLPGRNAFWTAVQQVYRRHAPDMVGFPVLPEELPTSVEEGFLELGIFEEVAVCHYPWEATYTSEEYIELLQTFSGHIALPDGIRHDLLYDIAQLIDQDFDGQITKPHITVLQIVRRIQRTF